MENPWKKRASHNTPATHQEQSGRRAQLPKAPDEATTSKPQLKLSKVVVTTYMFVGDVGTLRTREDRLSVSVEQASGFLKNPAQFLDGDDAVELANGMHGEPKECNGSVPPQFTLVRPIFLPPVHVPISVTGTTLNLCQYSTT